MANECCGNCRYLFQNDKKEPCLSCWKKVCVNKRHKTYAFKRTNFIHQTVNRPINYDYLGGVPDAR